MEEKIRNRINHLEDLRTDLLDVRDYLTKPEDKLENDEIVSEIAVRLEELERLLDFSIS